MSGLLRDVVLLLEAGCDLYGLKGGKRGGKSYPDLRLIFNWINSVLTKTIFI